MKRWLIFSTWMVGHAAFAQEPVQPAAPPPDQGIFNPRDAPTAPAAPPPPDDTRPAVPAAPYVEPPRRAAYDESGCLTPLVCLTPGPDDFPTREKRPIVYALTALLPFGGTWGPVLALPRSMRPSFEGELAFLTILHALLPWLALPAPSLLGALFGLVVGGIVSAALLGAFYAAFFGLFTAILLPFAGGAFGAGAGAIFGVVFGLVAGGFWTGLTCFALGLPLGFIIAGIGQFYLGPMTVVRAWERAFQERGPIDDEKVSD